MYNKNKNSLYHYYQLVKPYESDKIIKTKSLEKAVQYFVKDLKTHNSNCKEFSLVDINDKTLMCFSINIKS